MIAIVARVGTNIASIQYALQRLGKQSVVTCCPKTLFDASHIILPGVSTAVRAMNQLTQHNLVDVIRALTQPVLAICSSMQILFTESEEGNAKCLGVFSQKVKKLIKREAITVPHMGWNQLMIKNFQCPLLKDIDDGTFVYFVHSYAVEVGENTTAYVQYNKEFSAVVNKNNFWGTQFHPERSGKIGEKILNNFLNIKSVK